MHCLEQAQVLLLDWMSRHSNGTRCRIIRFIYSHNDFVYSNEWFSDLVVELIKQWIVTVVLEYENNISSLLQQVESLKGELGESNKQLDQERELNQSLSQEIVKRASEEEQVKQAVNKWSTRNFGSFRQIWCEILVKMYAWIYLNLMLC